MSDDLHGLRLWITRPKPAAHRSAAVFEGKGARCIVESTVRLQALNLSREERERLRGFLPQARLVLTSANAVRFLLESVNDDPELCDLLRVASASAVGEATAKAALERGIRVDHVASKALGVELARELVERDGLARVVLPGSDLRRGEAEDILREGGVEVLRLTVYRTVPAEEFSSSLEELLVQGKLDLAVVYSPSAVRGMVQGARRLKLKPQDLPPCAALGPVTAQAAREAGFRTVETAAAGNEESLLQAAVRWWTRRRESR